jgi:hypothetical protein
VLITLCQLLTKKHLSRFGRACRTFYHVAMPLLYYSMALTFKTSDGMAPSAWVGNSGAHFIRVLKVSVHQSLKDSEFIAESLKHHLSSHAIVLLLLQKIPKDQLLVLE